MAQLLTGALAQVDQARDQLRAGHPELANVNADGFQNIFDQFDSRNFTCFFLFSRR